MTPDELAELAAGYAVGGLDGEERARFEALLRAGDPAARAALREYEAVLVAVADGSREAPPAGARARLLERIDREGRGAQLVDLQAERRRRGPWRAVVGGLLAAGLAAVVVGLALSSTYERRLDDLQRETATLRDELARQQAVLAIVRDPSTQSVALAGLAPSPGARGRMLWHERAGGLFVAEGLPPAPEGKAYQLWAIAGSAPPVSAGVFLVTTDGKGSVRVPPLPGVARVDVFAVTLEPAGGLPAPSGAMYLAGKS